MANHEITVEGDGYQLFLGTGLLSDEDRAPVLLVRYDAGDCDTPQTWAMLYEACYDAHQMYDGWKTGDTLSFKGTVFARIESFHVIAQRSTLLPDKDAFDQELPV